MFVHYPHDRLVQKREFLLRELAKYEDLKMLDAWNETWAQLAAINRILELNP